MRHLLILALLSIGPSAEGAISVASGAMMPAYRSAGTFIASATTCTPGSPAGLAAGDILLAVGEAEGPETISLSTANGFTEIPDSPQAGHDGDGTPENPENRIGVFWKRAAGGDSMPVFADSGDHTTCRVYAFSGAVGSGDPWDVTAGGNDSNANDQSAVIPGDTTTVAKTLIVLIQGTSNNGTSTTNCGAVTNSDLANITERTDNSNTQGLGGGHCLITGEKASAGSYADSTLTMSVTTYKGAISIALKGTASNLIASVQGTVVNQLTIPSMETAGNDRFLFVGTGNSASTPRTVSTVVRGGSESLTEQWDINNGVQFACSGHYKTAPATAAASIVVTWSATTDELAAGSIAFTGVDQGSPIGTHCTDGGSTSSSTATCSADDTDWLVDISYGYGSTHTAGADQTSRWEQESIASATAAGSSTQLGSANDVMSWTGYTNNQWAIGALPLNESTGGPPPCALSIALMGVGCR